MDLDKKSYCIVFDLDSEDAYLGEKVFVLDYYRNHELPKNAKIIEVDMTLANADILSALAGTYKNAEELAQKLIGVCDVVQEIESKKGTAQNLAEYLEGERGKRLAKSLGDHCIKTSPYLDENSTEEA